MSRLTGIAWHRMGPQLLREALNRELIGPDECRVVREAQQGGGRSGPSRAMGDLLLDHGYLTRNQMASLVRELETRLLGQILVRGGRVTPAQVGECVRLQEKAEAAAAGPVPRLGELLVRKGYVTVDAVIETLREQGVLVRLCHACGMRYNVRGAKPESDVPCPSCNRPMHPIASPRVPGVDESAIVSVPDRPAAVAATEPAPPAIPELVKYTLKRELGRGGMGVVYKAMDLVLQRTVALKMMLQPPKADQRKTQDHAKRFLREARLCAKMAKHPNIVGIYDVGVLEGRFYLAMEYIEGPPLDAWMRDAAVPMTRKVALLHDVAQAVHHAHEQGIVHRDLKPANILVDARGRPHVSDFGLARMMGAGSSMSLTADGMIVGSPTYMSPEQALGQKGIDRRADVYPLGVILYEMLTGRPPFVNDKPMRILEMTVKSPVPPPSTVVPKDVLPPGSPLLEVACLKALAKKPADRHASTRAFAMDLRRWLTQATAPKA